ncbi:EID1-like F-box protein 3 [Triticum urartu]|uniref:F-box domain-containing protein n=1 Tax=Triticum urartu TaxID=4572 RepID=A0A8R7TZ99_TRIUA|nr:EID1-like F-box protein 3 [Triticum urartu]XP_048568240.1 EID1-like F-box protein 3 [Triticum urartu]
MSEGARNTRQFRGAWSGGGGTGGIGSASYRDGDGGIGSPRYSGVNTGILDEQVLSLVFRSINWDPQALCTAASVSRRLRAVAERVLWRELCISRAPRMVASLTEAAGVGVGAGAAPPPSGRIGGGWPALAKLLSFCCGAAGTAVPVPGHLTRVSRFSKTSGRSFLSRRCRTDMLYVSDPCEHAVPGADDDLGAYRGVFRWFMRSRTRACLLGRQAELDPRVRCPYCGARVWNMVAANLVPRGASRRMGSDEGRLEYYVCVSGHVHGNCWLAHLTSSEGEHDDDPDSHDASEGSSGDDGHVAQ